MSNCRLRPFSLTGLLVAFLFAGPALRAADSVELKLRPKAGETQKLAALIEQKISQTINGNTQLIQQTIGLGYTFAVQTVDPSGNASIKVTYDTVTFKQSSPNGDVDYSSEKPPAQVPPMAKGFAALAGQGFEMTISPTGRISEIKGLDAMIDAIIKKLELPEGAMKAQVEKTVRAQFGEDALKENMENMLAIYPEQPVNIGDSWQKTIALTKGFPLKIDNTFTLKSAKEGVASIDVKSKLSTNPDAPPMDMGQAKLSYNLSGDQTGTMQVNQANGWVQSAQMTQKATGNMKMDVGGGGRAMDIPISIETTMKLEAK